MIDLEQLANDLVDFSKDYDYYEFIDIVDDEEEEYKEQLNNLHDFKSVMTTIKYLNIIKDDIEDNLRDSLFNNYALEGGYGDRNNISDLKNNFENVTSILNKLNEHIESFDYEEVNEKNVLEFYEENHNFDYDYEYIDGLKHFVDKKEMLTSLIDDYSLIEIDGKYYYDSNANSKELDEREV